MQVQARLFPQTLPECRTLDYAGVCVQARQVGGDYYDFLSLGANRLGFVIGDISGKGMPAALLMANLQANVRSHLALAAERPGDFLKSVNERFYENTPDSSYATLVFAEYQDDQRSLRYLNCGHLPVIVLRHGGHVDRLESTGTVLGLFNSWNCDVRECSLACGDTVVFYTDGVVESLSPSLEEFGEERLLSVLRRSCHLDAAGIVSEILTAIRGFSGPDQYDDITLIVARCRE
jgi:serine phosphatase RsbU (regulator of sigma subunit)